MEEIEIVIRKQIILNYFFALLMISFSINGFVTAFDLDPGGGNGGGDPSDLTAPYITSFTPTRDIISEDCTISASAQDNYEGSGVQYVRIKIDGITKKTSYSSSCTYSWDIDAYDAGTVHTVVIETKDNEGNTRTKTRNYIAGYTEEVVNYCHQHAYMEDGDNDDFDSPIAYTIIETDRFVIIMQITVFSMLISGPASTLVNYFDVATLYYCKDAYRLNYNLDPDERPLNAPDGTLIELNFEMEESNLNLADNSIATVVTEKADDRSFWPNFNTPDEVAATNLAIDVLSMAIGKLTDSLSLCTIGGFVVNTVKDHMISKLREGNTAPFETGYAGANSVDIDYRNSEPNGQNTLYPENMYNYAYDAISRHSIYYRFDKDDSLIGQTIGLKFRCNAEYVDSRTGIIDTIYSDWVSVEFKLVS